MTTTSLELTTPPTTLPPQPATSLPPTTPAPTTPLPPEVTTRKEQEAEAGGLVVVTQSDTEGTAATPVVVTVAMELAPVTNADELIGVLDHVMPSIIPPHEPDSSPLEVVTEPPISDTHEDEGALSVAEPLTPATSGFPLPTPFPVGEPDDTESSLYLDLTQAPTPVPTQDSHTESGGPDTDPEVLLWPKEETGIHAESAVQPENDTATFSAATVLSGDGEVDHAHPSYPHLLDTDSELDYQYDPADGFLPVSSASSLPLPPPSSSSSTSSCQSFSSFPVLPAPDWTVNSCCRSRAHTDVPVCPRFPVLPLLSYTVFFFLFCFCFLH